MAFISSFNNLIGAGFILLSLSLLIFILSLIIPHRALLHFKNYTHKNSLPLAFLLSLASIIGSLTYSEIIGLLPCELCFWQRIFLYPVAVITALALICKKESLELWREILALSTIGSLFSIYHILIQFGETSFQCSINNSSNGCATIQTQIWGLITIPEMSLLLSVILICLSILKLKTKNN